MRLILAIQCFFAVLFGHALPAPALPPPREPEEPEDKRLERERLARELSEAKAALGRAADEAKAAAEQAKAREQELEAARARLEGEAASERKRLEGELGAAKAATQAAEDRAQQLKGELEDARGKVTKARDDGALALLSWLQREGRLIDFLREDIDEYEDEQVGAAVRAIHKGCRKVLDEALALEPILPGAEESRVEVPAGFDPVQISLTGKVAGDPPFKGTLMHHGWRTTSIKVPVPETVDTHVLAAAEVEL
ncbi:MAG: DUF2760 domain-containing protein [Planctomycetota bacterium]